MLLPTANGDRVIGIVRAHLEEDAAKTVHVGGRSGRIGGADSSLVDYNRGGTPLVEIVTAPDIRSADEAKRFLQLLRQTIVELGISDAEMEKGTLRVDANVSVRPTGSDELRTRTEIKNMNSFNFIARGIEAEVERQIGVWESGGEVEQQTYDFDAGTGTLTARRSKEEADDYRYFPEPDLVPVEPATELVEALRAELPESPAARIRRIEPALDLERATVLVTGGLDRLWDETVAAGADGVASANVIANNLVGAGVDPAAVPAVQLAKLVTARDAIPRGAFDEAVSKLGEPGFSADSYVAQEAVSDTGELAPIVDRILEENPGQVAAYRGGKEGLLGFFVGQVMKETQGKANPRVVSDLVREKLRGLGLRNLQLASDVEARALGLHERRHRALALGLDVRQAVALTRVERVPDRDPDDLVALLREAFVGANHAVREVRRPPCLAELVVRPRFDRAGRDPDDRLIPLHRGNVANRFARRSEPRRPPSQRGKEIGMKRGVLLLTLGAAVASAVVAAALVGAVGPSGAQASSHREAPLIADDPAADNTDVYAFVSPDKPNTVTIIANYIPFEDPAGGPNYYRFDPTVLYALNIDNNGDGREDVAYHFRFKTQVSNPNTFLYNTGPIDTPANQADNLSVKQTYSVTRVTKSGSTTLGSNLGVPPTNIGPRSNSATYAPYQGVVDLGGDRKVFAGSARRSVLRRPGVDLRSRRPAAVQLPAHLPARGRARDETAC